MLFVIIRYHKLHKFTVQMIFHQTENTFLNRFWNIFKYFLCLHYLFMFRTHKYVYPHKEHVFALCALYYIEQNIIDMNK